MYKNIKPMLLRNYRHKLRELELEYRFKKQEMDASLLAYEKTIQDKMHDLDVRCANDTADHEHEYHEGLQIKYTELAKIESLIKAREETAKNDKIVYERLLKVKDDEISHLNTIINNLIEKVGTIEGKQTFIKN